MIPEEMTKIRELLGPAFSAGKYDDASQSLPDLVNNDTFIEFLTLPAYERIDEVVAGSPGPDRPLAKTIEPIGTINWTMAYPGAQNWAIVGESSPRRLEPSSR